ncbi:MAG: PHA/PHB synthase family protein [Caulobacteraceae bacterium]
MSKVEVFERLQVAIAPPDACSKAMPPRSLAWADFDRLLHAWQGKAFGGVSPLTIPLAFGDWAAHAANAPFRAVGLALKGARSAAQVFGAAVTGGWTAPEPLDHRFSDPRWLQLPFALWREAFLRVESLADSATTGTPGVSPHRERLANFVLRQWLDVWSPSNVPWLNPEVVARTLETDGANLRRGAENLAGDLVSATGQPRPDGYELGRNLAVTPGKVVFRNRLIELIQYAPQTETVAAEPVLIVPAWIMKYYILDLSPENSLIRHLVGKGHTVFCISWRNPGPELRDVAFDDYRQEGVMGALAAVGAICPVAKVHACGYCLGGTLLSVAAAAMARDGDLRLASVTLLCTQVDFSEAGELQLFTSDDQVAFLDDLMAVQGYLDGRQMGGAFQLLRSRDLIWSRLVRNYQLGERDHPNDLMVWNEDATRMPYRMHAEYLRALYLDNDLAEGRLCAGGGPVALSDITVPFFVVATETDHVAPWRSVFKIQLLNPGEVTFVLTNGGHNAGIVSEPGHPDRRFQIDRREAGGHYRGPDEWRRRAERRNGSWWPAWTAWLAAHSQPSAQPPPLGAPERGYPVIAEAPGSYVHER